uniref:Putative secreted protein n=1 Tax=Anopheles darlingi TaxID=43151 RepID=A0A2M4DKL0_ANODA
MKPHSLPAPGRPKRSPAVTPLPIALAHRPPSAASLHCGTCFVRHFQSAHGSSDRCGLSVNSCQCHGFSAETHRHDFAANPAPA